MSSQYETWSREDLIARLLDLETKEEPEQRKVPRVKRKNQLNGLDNQLKPQSTAPPRYAEEKPFVFDAHAKRKIALKFCYSGLEYGGLAFQGRPGPLPTVEKTIFDALTRARLVDSAKGLEGCGWERCGRTDRGVSAAGQVVSFWIRSALPKPDTDEQILDVSATDEDDTDFDEIDDPFGGLSLEPESSSNALRDVVDGQECDYVVTLNAILPPTIRILAYSPVPPEFSARYACRGRHYKYFFTSACPSTPHDRLDVDSMRDAAKRLVGEHDFRNLCKLDPNKQITEFHRTVVRADISSLGGDGTENERFVFDLVGSAFLYHQVRHIMAVLFMVGSGLEHPSVVSSLLNVTGSETSNHPDEDIEIVSQKPTYEMADALPLMLWDCIYDDGVLNWRIGDERETALEISEGGTDLYHQMQSIYDRNAIRNILDAHFFAAAARITSPPKAFLPLQPVGALPDPDDKIMLRVPQGGATYKRTAKYVPLLQRPRHEDVMILNERWRNGAGVRRDQRRMAESQTPVSQE